MERNTRRSENLGLFFIRVLATAFGFAVGHFIVKFFKVVTNHKKQTAANKNSLNNSLENVMILEPRFLWSLYHKTT